MRACGSRTCAVVPHGGLLEEAVDLQHLGVVRFGLQLLHLGGSHIKLSLKQQRKIYQLYYCTIYRAQQCIQIYSMKEQVGIEHLALCKGCLQVRLWTLGVIMESS